MSPGRDNDIGALKIALEEALSKEVFELPNTSHSDPKTPPT